MIRRLPSRHAALCGLVAPLALLGCSTDRAAKTDALAPSAIATSWEASGTRAQIVAMRRLTEAQYRNAIADIFGPDIRVAGRFEPIVRPEHQLIATGATSAAISPTGLEQFDAMARSIADQVFDEAHRASFVGCAPRDAAAPDPECARAVLEPIGRYVYRRPQTPGELGSYVAIANAAAAQTHSFYGGLKLALAAMLVSPDFLYVTENAEPDPTHPGDLRLDAYSRASRLSFLLWDTTPNDALLKAAADGRLQDQAQLTAIARDMVASPRFKAGVRAFFADMLMFESFDDLSKDAVVYPRFNPAVAAALPEQLLRTIVDALVTRQGDYRELFTTRHTFMTRALGPLYGVQVHKRTGWEPYTFGPNEGRAGLLSQAGFLALYAHSGRSSPTRRGRAIRELLLCQPVPNPPGNVNFAVVQNDSNKAMPTARIRLSAHVSDPVCAACHKITDPIGLPLEHFDGIGAFRATENGAPIDVSGNFEGKKFDGVEGLGEAISTSPAAAQCVAGRALEYATGRSTDDEGSLVDGVTRDFEGEGYRMAALMLRVATMPEAYRVHRPLLAKPEQISLLETEQGGRK